MKKKSYIKKFGNASKEDALAIETITLDGKNRVVVVTPKQPTEKIKEETGNFLLHELDDHKAYDEYIKEVNRNRPAKMNKEERALAAKAKEFMKGLFKCPICRGKMTDCNKTVVKEARGATVLNGCTKCEILVGRY